METYMKIFSILLIITVLIPYNASAENEFYFGFGKSFGGGLGIKYDVAIEDSRLNFGAGINMNNMTNDYSPGVSLTFEHPISDKLYIGVITQIEKSSQNTSVFDLNGDSLKLKNKYYFGFGLSKHFGKFFIGGTFGKSYDKYETHTEVFGNKFDIQLGYLL